jgi:hypothetical protein
MKQTLWIGLVLLAGGWCGLAQAGPYMSSYSAKPCADGCSCGVHTAPAIPGMVGPWGQPVDMVFPYNANPPGGEEAARAMLSMSVPYDLQMAMMAQGGAPIGGLPGSVGMQPPSMPMQGNLPGTYPTPAGLPPLPPGMTGTFTTPGGGVVQAGGPGYGDGSGLTLTQLKELSPKVGGIPSPFPVCRTEVRFTAPAGMKVSWFTTQPDGKQGFGPQSLEVPGRYNFLQAAIYRLKLSDIPNRPGVELYPTLEVVPANSRTSTFLAHSAVPVTFTEDDFDQVAAGNFVVKVIYLPDPQYQDLAATGLAEVVSTQLEPGADPIAEAQRRGSILLVVRLGNIDLEAPNTPAMDAPGNCLPKMPLGPPPGQIMGMQPNLPGGPARMIPYGAVPDPNFRPPAMFPYQPLPAQPTVAPRPQGPGGLPPANVMPNLPAPTMPNVPPGMPPQGPAFPPQGLPTARPGMGNSILQTPSPSVPPGQFNFNPGMGSPSLQGPPGPLPGQVPPGGGPAVPALPTGPAGPAMPGGR